MSRDEILLKLLEILVRVAPPKDRPLQQAMLELNTAGEDHAARFNEAADWVYARIRELEAERYRLGKLYSHLVKRVFDQYGLIMDSVWEKRVLSGEHDVPIPERDRLANQDWIDRQVEHLRMLQPNWDSYGGRVPTEAALKAAGDVLRAKGQLTPCSDGGVQIDWPGAELSFDPNGEQEWDNKHLIAENSLLRKALEGCVPKLDIDLDVYHDALAALGIPEAGK